MTVPVNNVQHKKVLLWETAAVLDAVSNVETKHGERLDQFRHWIYQVCHFIGTAVETTYYFLILEGLPVLQGIYENSLFVL